MVQKLCYASKSVTDGRTDARTHKRPRSNMPLQLLRSWGHKNISREKSIFLSHNTMIVFLFLHENMCCGYSLKAPRRVASNDYPQHMFSCRNKTNIYLTSLSELELYICHDVSITIYRENKYLVIDWRCLCVTQLPGSV